MRIHLSISAPKNPLPFNHQHLLVGTIHKWLGWNEEHGKVSLYSFSRFEGGKVTKSGLLFENGISFFFSSHYPELIQKFISGVQTDRTMFNGLEVSEIVMQEDPDLSARELFFPGSPVFIKRKNGEKIDHILYNDPRAGVYLKETLLTKMDQAGLKDETLEINFDTGYRKAGSKMVNYNGIHNRASWCSVIMKGKPETKLFAWNVGLGNSTGIGFGAII
ncbi:MAG TPA: CRISPR-associated endoribonuclease Cas6 [Bacteroidales bacterium]|nr:CRISPR-associated endoribonuclease Cas6 [Bacteroidales bacterium]